MVTVDVEDLDDATRDDSTGAAVAPRLDVPLPPAPEAAAAATDALAAARDVRSVSRKRLCTPHKSAEVSRAQWHAQ